MTVTSSDTAQRVLARTITTGMSLDCLAEPWDPESGYLWYFGVKSTVFVGQISGMWHTCKVGGSAPLQTGEEVVGAMHKQQMRRHLKAHLNLKLERLDLGTYLLSSGINTEWRVCVSFLKHWFPLSDNSGYDLREEKKNC